MNFEPNPKLLKKNENSKIFVCTQCGECCHIREDKYFTQKEEEEYKKYMYKSFGIIYLAGLHEITISIWPEEKESLEKEAKKKKTELKIRPKRAVYNSKTNQLIMLDYFIDHETCPFFDKKKKQCTVYESRPLICRSYPLLSTNSYGKCKYKKTDLNAYGQEKKEAAELEQRIIKQKNLLHEMILKDEIRTHMNDTELKSVLSTAKITELRMMKK